MSNSNKPKSRSTTSFKTSASYSVEVEPTIAWLDLSIDSKSLEYDEALNARAELVDAVHRVIDSLPALRCFDEGVSEYEHVPLQDEYDFADIPERRPPAPQGPPVPDKYHRHFGAKWNARMMCDISDERADGIEGAQASSQLQEGISRLSGLAGVKIYGPTWTIDENLREFARQQALMGAMQVAKGRTEAAFAPFGGRIIGIEEASTETSGGGHRHTTFYGLTPAAESSQDNELPRRSVEIGLETSSVKVDAQIHVKFLIDIVA